MAPAFCGLNPFDQPIPDTVSADGEFSREVIGETFNKADWRAGWKKAYAKGYRVQRCTVSTPEPYRNAGA